MNTEEYLRRLRTDFGFFLWNVWEVKGYNKPHIAPLSEVEIDLAEFGANYRKPGSLPWDRRLIGIGGTRGLGKTYLMGVGFPCWRLLRDPNREILIISKSSDHAKKTVRLIREWVRTVPFLQHLEPRDGVLDNAFSFSVSGKTLASRQASVTAVGIGGQTEGNRAHTIIADDIETLDNSVTVEARDSLRLKAEEFVHILYPAKEANVGDPPEIVYVQTPKHEETVLLDLQTRGFSVRGYPVAYPRPEQKVINLAPMLADRLKAGVVQPGDPVFPLRFNKEKILQDQSASRLSFERECMLIADMAEKARFPLRLSDLIVMDVPPIKGPVTVMYAQSNNAGSTRLSMQSIAFDGDHIYGPSVVDTTLIPYAATKAAIDPAGRGTDKTGLCIASQLSGLIFVHECLGLEGGFSEEKLDEMMKLCHRYGVTHLLYEGNNDDYDFVGNSIQQAIRRIPDWLVSVDKVHNTAQKELRIIETLEPVMSQHRLVMNKNTLKLNEPDNAIELQYQLTRLTKERKSLSEDGKIDALAMVVRAHEGGVSRPKDVTTLDHLRREYERLVKAETDWWDKRLGTKRAKVVNAFRRLGR